MNPGTTILIILGLIGLLLYASKALSNSAKEGFAVVDDSQISNVGKEAFDNLKEGAMNLDLLLGAFKTPELNSPLSTTPYASPSLKDLQIISSDPTPPLPPTSLPPTSLPINAPASTLVHNTRANKSTISDLQGTGVAVASHSPNAPAAKLATVAATAAPVAAIASAALASEKTAESSSRPITTSDLQGTQVKHASAPKSALQAHYSAGSENTAPVPPQKTKVVYLPRKCPPMPDMSQYIRKDQIPCWGCNLK